jgi:Uncharacterized protein conserved in bacteria
MTSDMIRYDHAVIDDGVAAIVRAANEVRAEMDDLASHLSSLFATWEGDGNGGYAEAKRLWDSAYSRLDEIGREMAVRVANVNDSMRDTDGRVAKRFRGV